jgi:glyoxylase I family protein
MLNLKSIHHVAIICSDYQASKYFYTEVLGLKIVKETYRANRSSYKLDLLVNDKYQIELFSFPNPPKRITNPEASGLRHLSFEVDDLNKAFDELNRLKIVTESIRLDELTGKNFVFFSDPDGLPIELYES